jgi:signal transduction histidine kinase
VAVGFKIQLRDATLGGNGLVLRPSISSGVRATTKAQRRWIEVLHLDGKSWIDVPVMQGNTLAGVLACEWWGEEDVLSGEDQEALVVVAKLLAAAEAEMIQYNAKQFAGRLGTAVGTLRPDPPRVSDLLDSGLGFVREVLGAPVGALFLYDWTSNKLRKIAESTAPGLKARQLDEAYEPNQHLTGRAWENPAYRHIIDYGHLCENGHALIDKRSHDRHTDLLGEIRTVLYARSSTADSRLLFRLMNRLDEPRSPYYLRHQKILHEVTERLTDIADDKGARRRLYWLQHIGARALMGLSQPDAVLGDVRTALQEEHVDGCAVLYGPEQDDYLQLVYVATTKLGEHKAVDLPRFTADPVFKAILESIANLGEERQSVQIVDLPRHGSITLPTHPLNMFSRIEASAVVVWPLRGSKRGVETGGERGSEVRGALLLPLFDSPSSPGRLLQRISDSVRQFIDALATIIESHASTTQSHVTSVRAQRLIGQIGHEISSPVSSLAGLARGTIKLAKAVLSEREKDDPELSETLREIAHNEADLLAKAKEISLALNIANQMARIGSGTLSTTFVEYDLYKVMKEAADEVLNYSSVMEEYAKRPIQFRFNDASKRLPLMIGDPILIKKVFDNLFSNAIKYSYVRNSRRLDEPIRIEVQANPVSGWTNVYIQNWGLGIPPDKIRTIFRAFERADVQDPRERRRGMGLGLYLAKVFLDFHDSSISCTSEPTLDDKRRTIDLSGYLTTFELKLRQRLSRGPIERPVM